MTVDQNLKRALPAMLAIWLCAGALAQQTDTGPAAPPPPPAPVSAAVPQFLPPNLPGRPKLGGDLNLQDAVKAALEHSPMVLEALAEHQAASADARRARSMARLQVSASALAFGASTDMPMQTASSPPVMPSAILNVPDRGSAGSALMLMTPLYTGGRLGGMIRSAQEQERSRQQRTEGVKLDAAFLVKTAYRRVLFTRAAVDVYQELVRAAEERVRVARERYAAGSANLAEVLRNQTALADALQRLASARAEAETALVGLKTEMGVSLASEVRLVSAPDRPPIEGTVDDALARALRSRPEIVEAEAYLKAAEADLAAAKALYRPQVYLSAMHSLTTAGGSSMKGAGVGLTVSIPVADGGSRSAEVDKATARVEVARQRLEAVKLRVAQEVSAAWLAAKAAEVNVGTSEAAVQQAEKDYRIAQLRYEAGKSINVEVIDALAALVQARTNHVQALYEFGVAKDKLERAVGGM